MDKRRQVVFYKNYFLDFYKTLTTKDQEKIDFILHILEMEPFVSQKYVKHITNSQGIYEIRISGKDNEYRVLFFFEKGSLIEGGKIVLLGNGFIKKDNRDYIKAVQIAEEIKSQFFQEKEQGLIDAPQPPSDEININEDKNP